MLRSLPGDHPAATVLLELASGICYYDGDVITKIAFWRCEVNIFLVRR